MIVSEYQSFVAGTDQFKDTQPNERWDIALYGLSGEIGSVVSAIKKKLLSESGADWRTPNQEIKEELGDALWYCFYLAMIHDGERSSNLLLANIKFLHGEISASTERAKAIRGVLADEVRERFLSEAGALIAASTELGFDDYQKLAFKTARTETQTLVEVCLAVLWQLVAELLRSKLPDIERTLNTSLPDRPIEGVLGEVVWHLSALASVYGLTLSEIIDANRHKVSFRRNRGERTLLHDRHMLPAEQLPRRFEIGFVTFAQGKARMYLEGRKLGDNLTDNNYDEDGYRYHDVMHLANAAVLGWSPVLRDLMRRKRRSDPKTDEVEDGARAKIVEEAVIKAIHSEGMRLASMEGTPAGPTRLFANRNDISFRFLNLIRTFVRGLEAESNSYWEWEEAIHQGHEVFAELRAEGQGTVTVDLDEQKLTFRPDVCIDLVGGVAAFGSAIQAADIDEAVLRARVSETEIKRVPLTEADRLVELIVRKAAILDALGLEANEEAFRCLDITPLAGGRVSIRGHGQVRKTLWDRQIIRFRTSLTRSSAGLHCTAIGVADLS